MKFHNFLLHFKIKITVLDQHFVFLTKKHKNITLHLQKQKNNCNRTIISITTIMVFQVESYAICGSKMYGMHLKTRTLFFPIKI